MASVLCYAFLAHIIRAFTIIHMLFNLIEACVTRSLRLWCIL